MVDNQQDLTENVAEEVAENASEPTEVAVAEEAQSEDAKAPAKAESKTEESTPHADPSIGYKGEIVGRVLSLAELDAGADAETEGRYDELARMIDQTLTNVSAHEIVTGRVVSIGDKDVVIDIGFKSDGIVSRNEFPEDLESGQDVEVYLERIEDYHGQLVLSKTKADTVKRWRRIEEAFEKEKVLEGTIVRRIKGGMIVELFDGVEAFLPGSQIDVRPVRDFDAYLEKRMEFKIVKLNPANENCQNPIRGKAAWPGTSIGFPGGNKRWNAFEIADFPTPASPVKQITGGMESTVVGE